MHFIFTETGTILAALRHFQACGFTDPAKCPAHLLTIATVDHTRPALDNADIDFLCERLNHDEDLVEERQTMKLTLVSTSSIPEAIRYQVPGNLMIDWESSDLIPRTEHGEYLPFNCQDAGHLAEILAEDGWWHFAHWDDAIGMVFARDKH